MDNLDTNLKEMLNEIRTNKNKYLFTFKYFDLKISSFEREMKQNEFDQKEFNFCKKILVQKKIENPTNKKFNMKGFSQINDQILKNEQITKINVLIFKNY